jgi:tripartite-type tricarboxylate transporter receptor subunit TctC
MTAPLTRRLTRRELVASLNKACNEVLAQPDIVKRLLEPGVTTPPGSPAAFCGFVKDQVNALSPLVKSIRVTL